MMIRKTLHISLTVVFIFAALLGFSQAEQNVKATTDRKQILIGEPIQLTLEVNVPLGSSVTWPPLDSIPHFEFIEKNKIDSVENTDGKLFRQHLTITSFDSGTHAIQSLPFLIDNKKYLTDSIPIEMSFSKFDPKKDYHDIKDILDIENPYTRYLIWAVVLLTLIAAVFFIYFVQKKKLISTIEPREEVSKLSPYEQAMQSLEELKKQKLAESGNTKLFYTRLNDILRLFVARKLQISSMEKTNEELILQLNQLNISREQFYQLAESLRMSDFVKFAKYVPGYHDNENNFVIIESSIKLLNQIEK